MMYLFAGRLLRDCKRFLLVFGLLLDKEHEICVEMYASMFVVCSECSRGNCGRALTVEDWYRMHLVLVGVRIVSSTSWSTKRVMTRVRGVLCIGEVSDARNDVADQAPRRGMQLGIMLRGGGTHGVALV